MSFYREIKLLGEEKMLVVEIV